MSDHEDRFALDQVTRMEDIVSETRKDFAECLARAKDGEARKLISALESRTSAVLEEIRQKVAAGRIRPDLALRLSINDAPVVWPAKQVERVGFFATAGNPLYWGHIYFALCAILELDLNTVVVSVVGDHPDKRGIKQSKEHRRAIARCALQYFAPLLRYTPLGFDNMKIGEENASELLLLNYDLPLEVFYIAGGDVHEIAAANLAACRVLLKPRDGSETPHLRGLLFPRAQVQSPAEELCRKYPFLELARRTYKPFPTVRGQELSSSMFRADPDIPILPSRALDYILKQGLYRGDKSL
jgi:hypothetical protein